MKPLRAILLVAVLFLAGFLRLGELETFGPTPGDDISYLNGVRDTYAGLRRAIPSPPWWFVPLRPFFVANNLTQRTYEGMMCFTSQAKPLYLLKLSLIEGAGTLTLYGLQFANAVSGLLVVLVLFFLGKRLFSPGAGLGAAFLGAISPWLIHYSTYGVPTNDSALLLLLSLLLAVRPGFRPFLCGLAAGGAVMVNPTVVLPAGLLLLIAVGRALTDRAGSAPGGRKRLIRSLVLIAAGAVLPWILWEAADCYYWSYFHLPYRSFWEALATTRGDNLDHARTLPIDVLFPFRTAAAADGPPWVLLWFLGAVWGFVHVRRRAPARRFGPAAAYFLMAGVLVTATLAGTTQCARHYILFWMVGLVWSGAFLKALLVRGKRRGFAGLAAVLALVLAGACLVSALRSLAVYRRARRGWRDLSTWIEAEVPWDRIVTPANQPPNMWPAVKRFNNWFELEKIEKEQGPTWIVYGDYIAVTRGIWDFPYDMYPIALACRAVEGEDFRAGTHVSAPIFLYENEDYYWGFVRRKRVAFEPDVRVIPTARVLALKDKVDWPSESVVAPWIHADGEQGANVYRPFLDFGVYSHRSPWLGVGLVLVFFAGMLYVCLPPEARSGLKRRLSRRRTAAALGVLVLVALVFRNYGISLYSQMGGDDVEYRTYIERMRLNPDFAWTGPAKPFIIASWLSGLDVNKTITVFAKPYFILERTVLAFLTGGEFRFIHYLTCLQGVATVLVVFMIGRRLRGNLCGFIAASFWAVSPWAVTYSTWGIHVAGGVLAFAFTLWAYFAFVDRGRGSRALLFGLAAGTALMYSTSNIWPVLFLGIIESIHGPVRCRRRWPKLIPLWVAALAGLLLPWLIWEGVSSYSLSLVGYPHRWFPSVLLQATRDNLLHARALPVDILFFWRHLFLSEGWAAAALLTVSFLGPAAAVLRGKARSSTSVLVALTFSLTVVMNYTGIAQVIRHFFPAFLPLALLGGAVLSRWAAGKRLRLAALVAVLILVSWRQWHRLDLFRETRWAPDRVGIWAQGHLFVPGRLATLPCQNLGLWPGLRPVGNWREMEQLGRLVPPGAMMYGDYIEISLGSWLYSFPEYYEISEVIRGLPPASDLFRTPSYLAYLPNRFENEFYYWGLYRGTPPIFDPAIRVLPAPEILARYRSVRADPLRYRRLWEPTRSRPALKIPARPGDIYRPFMEALPRSSPAVPLAVSALIFLALVWRGRPRVFSPLPKD